MPKSTTIIGRIKSIGPIPTPGLGFSAQPPVSLETDGGQNAKIYVTRPERIALVKVLQSVQQAGQLVHLEVDRDTQEIIQVYLPQQAVVESLEEVSDAEQQVTLRYSPARYVLRKINENYDTLLQRLLESRRKKTPILISYKDETNEIVEVQAIENPNMGAPSDAAPPVEPAEQGVSSDNVQEAFGLAKNESCDPVAPGAACIPFLFPDDGCWLRAHHMRRLLQYAEYSVQKVWCYGNLRVRTQNHAACSVAWRYHVAIALAVEGDGGPSWWVIDPALFSEAVPSASWVAVQGDADARVVYTTGEVFYREPNGELWYDNDYSQTDQVLPEYRNRLALRRVLTGGPPYLHCSEQIV